VKVILENGPEVPGKGLPDLSMVMTAMPASWQCREHRGRTMRQLIVLVGLRGPGHRRRAGSSGPSAVRRGCAGPESYDPVQGWSGGRPQACSPWSASQTLRRSMRGSWWGRCP